MNLDIFTTPKRLPFLFYGTNETGMCLKADHFPITTIDPSDLWETMDVSKKLTGDERDPFCTVVSLCSRIALKSRRGCANMLFVMDEERRLWLKEKLGRRDVDVRVDPDLEPNEVRATYWRMMMSKPSLEKLFSDPLSFVPDASFVSQPLAVDGGIQISPEGLSVISGNGAMKGYDYRSYFARCFL